ncbi:tetratricopeptide repeat protein [Methanosarcina sp. UBA289]|uniref:tetratricopeptide repeat protein n=1 Tax=Methanosarcina sp. UBA289 TaxID=1915574 RepID=UPI0025D01F49|nr:tetratricopeptide repeat protein [Methanosarcina sp. UBA289]
MDNDVVEELLKIVVESLQSEEGNLNKAVDLAINFSTKYSISSDQLLVLSTFCGSEGSYELVYIFAKTAASLSTGHAKVAAHYNAGTASYFLNLPMEAEEQYKLALESDPKHVNTHYNYGILLSDMGRLDEAEEQYKLALESDPNDASTHSNYGILLQKIGRLEQAEEQYRIAINLDPKMPNSHGAYSLLLFSQNLEEEAIKETGIASRLFRENGDAVKEHLSFAWLYEKFTNKYYNLKDYNKSGEYAEISGDEYIEAGKQAGESFKNTSLTKGYTLKGRAKIRKLELQPPYEIEKFKEIMSGIYEASKFYKNAAEISPKDNQTCNACSISMLCLSEMLDYMLAVMKQKNVPRLEDEIEKWKKQLAVSEQIYKGSIKGEAFVQSLYKLMACIENLDKYKKFAMWKEEKAFEECVEELKEIAGNIEGPLQKIIEDSAAQMDVCRRSIMPYAGTETGQFELETPKINNIDMPVDSKQEDLKKSKERKKGNKIVKWVMSHPIKSAGSVIFAVILNHYSEALFSLIQKFVVTLLSYV